MTETPWELAAPPAERVLLEEHRLLLTNESGISEAVIRGRGYYSLTGSMIEQLIQLEVIVPSTLRATGWMGIPITRPDGVIHGEIIRVFGGLPGTMKYVWPTGVRNAIDVHPDALVDLIDPSIPLIVTEGIKKGDAIYSAAQSEGIRCVVLSLNGNYGWRVRSNGSSLASPDFMDIALTDRKVYIVPDSDYRTNDDVRAGWDGCATYLQSKTGDHRVYLVVVPPDGLEKQGADDYLAGGGNLQSLLGLAVSPRQALLDEGTTRRPLLVKGGLRMITEAVDEIPHLITPILPERAILVMAGHSGTFKTWHALGLALDGAFGLPWIDHPGLVMRADPFTTLYVNKEMGGLVLASRLKTLARNERYRGRSDYEHVLETRVLTTDEAELDLAQPTQRERLEEALLELSVQHVVLDSLSMCWTGDENSASEVGAFYSQLRGITERTGVSWTIIHHLLKPSASRNRLPAKFTVRGSGQIIQQADAAVILSPFNEDSGDPDRREVSIEPVKTRTDREPPAFVSRFQTNDGLFTSLTYASGLTEATAHAYTASHGDPSKFGAWISSELAQMPAMSPGSAGMRTRQLVSLLQSAWPVDQKQPPSEDTIRRRLSDLVEGGTLELLDESKRHGNLYRFQHEDTGPVPPRPALPAGASGSGAATGGEQAGATDH